MQQEQHDERLITALLNVRDTIFASEADKYDDSPNNPYGHCPISATTRNELLEQVAFTLRCMGVETSEWWS